MLAVLLWTLDLEIPWCTWKPNTSGPRVVPGRAPGVVCQSGTPPPHGGLMGTFIRTKDIKRRGVNSKQNKLLGDKVRGNQCLYQRGTPGKDLHHTALGWLSPRLQCSAQEVTGGEALWGGQRGRREPGAGSEGHV